MKQPHKLAIAVLVIFLNSSSSFAQPAGKYFDNPPAVRPVTISAFHPTDGTIETILTLRKAGLLPAKDLTVVGIIHEQEYSNPGEKTAYRRAQEMVDENGLDWIHFHVISSALTPENLFGENGCTPDFRKIFLGSDGILLFGGPDMPPAIYGEPTHLLTSITTPDRHYLEVSFVFHLLGAHKNPYKPLMEQRPTLPVVGFCLGCQTLNVGTGGTLVQDIPAEIYHLDSYEAITKLPPDTWHRSPLRYLYPEKQLAYFWLHPIRLSAGGFFCREWRFTAAHTPYVYSSHHQALESLGKGFRTAATSLDGKVIEAIEHTSFPNVLGVQFHPEASRIWKNIDYQYTTKDEGKPIIAVLEANPPSVLFHKLLWTWFTTEIYKYHDAYEQF